MAKVFESMKEATGIDLADIINAESYDAKVNRNVNVSGLDSVNFVVKDDGTKVTMAKVEPQNSTKPVSTDVPESGEQDKTKRKRTVSDDKSGHCSLFVGDDSCEMFK